MLLHGLQLRLIAGSTHMLRRDGRCSQLLLQLRDLLLHHLLRRHHGGGMRDLKEVRPSATLHIRKRQHRTAILELTLPRPTPRVTNGSTGGISNGQRGTRTALGSAGLNPTSNTTEV